MKYKIEVNGVTRTDNGTMTTGARVYALHAGNPRKASNRAKRKYCDATGCKWQDCKSRVLAVWRWLPGYRRV